jgi:Zn-dependent protease with chaperone function
MNATILLPLGGIALAWLLTGAVQRHLAPRAAARVLTGVAVGSALAVIGVLVLVGFGAATSQPGVVRLAEWCRVSTPDHHVVPIWVGGLATVLLMAGIARSGRALCRHVRSDAKWRRACDVEIIDSLDPVAFAVPGRPGTVVVSTAMLAALNQPERDAMLAHEHAHLRWNHHRYIRSAEVAASFLPLLQPLVGRVRFETERWADEEAANATSNRTVVATAVARAALASTGPADLAMGKTGVPQRVDALLNPRPMVTTITKAALVLSSAAVLLGLGSATVQLHHLVTFADHVCTAH